MEGEQEAKRVKLTIPQQNQGATPVDPENAAGKRSELEPIPGGEIANLPNESAQRLARLQRQVVVHPILRSYVSRMKMRRTVGT